MSNLPFQISSSAAGFRGVTARAAGGARISGGSAALVPRALDARALGASASASSLLPSRLVKPGAALALRLLVLAGALSCGSPTAEDEIDVASCTTTAQCERDHQICQNGACVESISLTTRHAGEHACSVVTCPFGTSCCSAAVASATSNAGDGYVSRLHLLEEVIADDGELSAVFFFEERDQQGWVTFELGEEMDIASLEFTGSHQGVADRYLTVNTKRLDNTGCAYAFDLQPRPAAPGSGVPFVFRSRISLDDDSFCYGDAPPGRAAELAFAIFSTQPGPATLTISNITLQAAD
jgi:hypothetical protein